MIKQILSALFVVLLLGGVTAPCYAEPEIEIIENDFQEAASISVVGSTLHVVGGNGQTLQIYNVTGVLVMSVKVEGPDKRYELNLPKGCYIVRVGKTVRKISIR